MFFLQRRRIAAGIAAFISGMLLALLVFSCVYVLEWRAPADFPDVAVFVVSNGKSLTQISRELEKENIIRSPFWFTNFVILLNTNHQIKEGEYYFEDTVSVYEVARRMVAGDYNLEQLRTTIPEGSTNADISRLIKRRYPAFEDIHFLTLARDKEGYLFPDTYLFGADVRPEKVIDVLRNTFDKKLSQPDIDQAIKASGRPLNEIITMASILEGEARQMQTRQIVAGILWKRLEMGMPLQVDATFKYINGKSSEELTLSDLKIDSPYNTYVYKGLPPTPISNPGLDSIRAAVTPIDTPYVYFLTDRQGNMRYAETLEEHAANKNRYLK